MLIIVLDGLRLISFSFYLMSTLLLVPDRSTSYKYPMAHSCQPHHLVPSKVKTIFTGQLHLLQTSGSIGSIFFFVPRDRLLLLPVICQRDGDEMAKPRGTRSK
jgi:hypothetical protein